MTSNCACGGLIVPASNDPEDVASAVLEHNRSERHRVGLPYAEPTSAEVYVEPERPSPAVRVLLGPTPCIACGEPVRVLRYPGGAIASLHPRGTLACRASAVAS